MVFSNTGDAANLLDSDINSANQYIATKWDQLNRSVDMFFTNKSSSTSENKSSIFAYSSFYKKEGQSIKSEYNFQLKFDLPNTTKKLKIVIEKQQDEISNALTDTSVTTNNKTISKSGSVTKKTETHYTAGVNFFLGRSKFFRSLVHFGIRLDMPLNPSLKIDLQKNIKLKYFNIGLSQKFIMYRQEGFQEISQLTFNKKLSKKFQADLINSLVWTDENDVFILRNNLVISQDLGEEKGLSYSIGANARFSPGAYYDNYDASVSYKQLIYQNWLYATLTLGADFPKSRYFDDEKFVQLRVDIFFKE